MTVRCGPPNTPVPSGQCKISLLRMFTIVSITQLGESEIKWQNVYTKIRSHRCIERRHISRGIEVCRVSVLFQIQWWRVCVVYAKLYYIYIRDGRRERVSLVAQPTFTMKWYNKIYFYLQNLHACDMHTASLAWNMWRTRLGHVHTAHIAEYHVILWCIYRASSPC